MTNSFFLLIKMVVSLGSSDPIVSQTLREFYAFHFLGKRYNCLIIKTNFGINNLTRVDISLNQPTKKLFFQILYFLSLSFYVFNSFFYTYLHHFSSWSNFFINQFLNFLGFFVFDRCFFFCLFVCLSSTFLLFTLTDKFS